MEDYNSKEALRKRLAPPKETTNSVVLNGIGNGIMLGFAPFMAMEMYAKIAGEANLHRRFHIASAAATVAGVVVGGYYGLKEARRLQEYRQTIGTEMADLSERVIDTNERISRWADRLEQHAAEAQSSQGVGR